VKVDLLQFQELIRLTSLYPDWMLSLNLTLNAK